MNQGHTVRLDLTNFQAQAAAGGVGCGKPLAAEAFLNAPET